MSSIQDRLNTMKQGAGAAASTPSKASAKETNSYADRLAKMKADGAKQTSGYTPAQNTTANTDAWTRATASQTKIPGKASAAKAGTASLPMDNVGTSTRPNSRMLSDVQTGGTTLPSLTKDRSDKYSLGKGISSVVLKGGQQVAQAAGNTAALAEDLILAPFELLSGQELGAISDNAPFNTWAKGIRRNGQELQEKYAENIAKGGKAAELFDTYGSSTVAAVPQAVLAMLTGGTSEAGTAAGLASTAARELTPSVANTVRNAVTAAAKDPQYWLSFGQVVGDGYEQALQDMQASGQYGNNTARTKAALYAIGNGLLNAEVEVGGGIQTLPEELKHGASAWKAWVDSMVDEGKEEVVQGVIERAMQNSVYSKGNPLVSLSDENAILNPRTSAQEFAGGAIVGGILGGGQTLINRAINARNAHTAPQEATGAQTDVREGNYAPTAQTSAEGAQNAASGVETAENVKAGQVTTIKKPYRGEVPTQTRQQSAAPVQVSNDSLTTAQNRIAGAQGLENSIPGMNFKSSLKNAYKSIFKPAKGVPVEGTTFQGKPYTVDINNNVPGKVISDVNLTAEKLALLDNLPEIVRNGTYVGSGEYVPHGAKTKKTVRYDYFESPVEIGGKNYVASFDVEVEPNVNNYRTHKLIKMDLNEIPGPDVGPTPTATEIHSSPVEGTRPLNVDSNIAQGAKNVKSDPLMDILFGKQGAENVTDTPGDAAAGAVNTDFDRMQAQSDTFHPVNENSARRIMNEQNRAPSEVPTVDPNTGNNITKTVSTILNSPLTSPEMTSIYENAIAGGKFDYTVQTDRDAVQRAQAHIARDGWQTVANTFIGKVDLGQSVSKVEMAEAISAYNTARSEGNHQAAFELGVAIADAAHTGAQVTQAMNLMNRLTPEGKLLTLRKFVDKLNQKQETKTRRKSIKVSTQADIDNTRLNYTEEFTGFRISDELASNYLMAETDAERAAAWDAITTDIASQLPSTFREKADFVRYSSMLTNPTTHIRNVLGNAIQAGARTLKNGIGAAIERAAIKDQSQRTKSLLVGEDAKALKDFARGQYETDQSAAMGAGKYSDYSYRSIDREIMSKKKAFKGDNLLSRGIQAIGDFNNAALDAEDVLFNKSAYVDSFAQALKAKGVTAEEAKAGTRTADVDAARAYAIEEARRATYRNTTALSEALSKMGRYEGDNPVLKAASFAADAFMPFRRTPANILTTGLDYSPVGLVKAVTADAVKVKNGTMSGADMVDHLSSGLTGTGILALGAYLAAEGLLHVRAGDDDKEEAFEKASGKQDYALQIGDYSYSLDWAVPAAMPLFAGAAIMQSAEKGGSSFDAVVDAMLGMQDVVLETSMLSSLNDLVSNISYAKSKPMYLIDRAISSYASQYIPTVGSKIASALDDTARKSYVEKGTGQVSSDVNYFLQGAAKKIPGARNQLQPSIDLWGNEVSNGSAPARVFQSFLSPGYLKKADDSAATKEVRRLAEATGDSSVYPTAMDKAFTVNGKEKTLTAAEYTQYAKSAGSTRKKLIEEVVDLPDYKAMSDTEKAAYVKRAYDYAKYTARKELAPGYKTDAWVENAKNAKRDIGVSTAEYLALYEKYGGSVMSGKGYDKVKRAVSAGLTVEEYMGAKDSADTDGNGSVTKAEAAAWISKSGKKNKADLWDIICTTNAKNPYK